MHYIVLLFDRQFFWLLHSISWFNSKLDRFCMTADVCFDKPFPEVIFLGETLLWILRPALPLAHPCSAHYLGMVHLTMLCNSDRTLFESHWFNLKQQQDWRTGL